MNTPKKPLAQEAPKPDSPSAERAEPSPRNGPLHAAPSRMPAVPSLALPRGGGAIRATGEKFSTNLASGTGGMSVPIVTSPGRGLDPSLALSYSTGAGNGPFGLGWALPVASVSRRTERGIPRYDATDTFLFADEEELVPDLSPTTPFAPVTLTRDEHLVERFRPRVMGPAVRIERWTRLADGDVHWRSTTADNVTSVFGRSPDTRVADGADASRVFRWLLEETRDDRGSIVRYVYKPEDLAGVSAATLYERNRAGDGRYAAQRYLERVLYGNRVPDVADGWLFEVVFDYGEHTDEADPYAAPTPWTVRADPFSTHRQGFELRTWRLCQRVLMFHRVEGDGSVPTLVDETRFEHSPDATATLLTAAWRVGHRAAGDPLEAPKVTFAYEPAVFHHALREAPADALPEGIDGQRYRFVDLDREGVSGVLTEQGGAWRYLRNLGDASFAAPTALDTLPTLAPGNAASLADLGGDHGLQLVARGRGVDGYFERTDEGTWAPMVPFRAPLNVSFDHPNVRMLDLDGDGVADVLIAEDDVFRWHPAKGREGFDAARSFPQSPDEERGPRLVFADGTGSIHLADMSGDGLTDLVRIRNGEVCYWPNQGHGRFGAKVAMADAPVFDADDRFRPDRLFLADLDGSGTTDLVYVGPTKTTAWINRSGNRWGTAVPLPSMPTVDDVTRVAVLDLLGQGTGCVVLSSTRPGDPSLRYIDLLDGRKPYVMVSTHNGLGAETTVTYAPSTRFYLQDRRAGRPWVTKLPFPVQVIERVETHDLVSGARHVSRHAYHHGYYDRDERELRGFAMVESWDAETLPIPGSTSFEELPPVHTKSWFHTGAFLPRERIEDALAKEYYREPAAPEGSTRHDPVVLPPLLPEGLSPTELREATRALRGSPLRQEVYADDGTPAAAHPYVVTTHRARVRVVQRMAGNAHCVVRVEPVESVTQHYERAPHDPRVSHELTLAVDAHGFITRSAAVAYARRDPLDDAQGRLSVVVQEQDWIHRTAEPTWHRAGLPREARAWELVTADTAVGRTTLYTVDALDAAFTGATEVPYEQPWLATPPPTVFRRLLGRSRVWYAADASPHGPLAAGDVESRALPHHEATQVFTEGLLSRALDDAWTAASVDRPALMAEGGYVLEDGAWWSPSGRVHYDADHFYLPLGFESPFPEEHLRHGVTTLTWEPIHRLFPLSVTDPMGNTVAAEYDPRTLAPWRVTDPNGNRSKVAVDPLGRVVATWAQGKDAPFDPEGDSDALPGTILTYQSGFVASPLKPAYVHVKARRDHDLPDVDGSYEESRVYSDGFGREVQTKTRCEPEPGSTDPRWIGTGRTVFNNKGLPIKKYEPYFASGPGFETEAWVVEHGVTPVVTYDPLGRATRTALPDGTLTRVEFSPWHTKTFDANDTVADSPWYAARAPSTDATAAEKRAAELSLAADNTPTLTQLDPLGRPYRTVVDNGTAGQYATRVEHDVAGRPLRVIDALTRLVQSDVFDLAGRVLRREAMDSGVDRALPDLEGKPMRAWTMRGFTLAHRHDKLGRQVAVEATKDGVMRVVEFAIYGEARGDAPLDNLRGRPWQAYDGAGLATVERYDFKGNPATVTRRMAADPTGAPDWSEVADAPTEPLRATAAAGLLADEVFTSRASHDARGRVTSAQVPRVTSATGGAAPFDTRVRETRVTYNLAGLLERVDVVLGSDGATPTPIVTAVAYNARRQRTAVSHGNGALVTSTYDAQSFRLRQLKTTRGGATRQDFSYTYDAAGNVVRVHDAVPEGVYHAGAFVDGTSEFEYDAIDRLVKATGRELAALLQPGGGRFGVLTGIPHSHDTDAVRAYTEQYEYDVVGNLTRMDHRVGSGPTSAWVRRYAYDTASNRLLATSLPGDAETGPYSAEYEYDPHGNMKKMPSLPGGVTWNHREEMVAADKGGGCVVHFQYDAAGERVRKTVVAGATVKERLYLGGWELYRKRTAGTLERAVQTAHVMDGEQRVAMIETRTTPAGIGGAAVERLRYQYGNHLGSACLELDGDGDVMSVEEYLPYGQVAWSARRDDDADEPRRYRFTGMEQDETGLQYHSARYYAPWLGRWTSPDPIGLKGGIGLFTYCHSSPLMRTDRNGCQDAGAQRHRDVPVPNRVDAPVAQATPVAPTAPAVPAYRIRQIEVAGARPIDVVVHSAGSNFVLNGHADVIQMTEDRFAQVEALLQDIARGTSRIRIDSLSLEHGRSEEYRRGRQTTLRDIAYIAQSDTGMRLLQSIEAAGRGVTITPFAHARDLSYTTATSNSAASAVSRQTMVRESLRIRAQITPVSFDPFGSQPDRRPGSASNTYYNYGYDQNRMNANFPGSNPNRLGNVHPIALDLAHELIHALRNSLGLSIREDRTRLEPGGASSPVRLDEFATTGLMEWADEQISENRIREELGVARRVTYLDP